MNKQELIDEYINNQRGKFPMVDGDAIGLSEDCILFRSEFQQRAKELGWVNGYKWGVEYPTNGKRPDLPDDVLVDVKCESGRNEWMGYTDLDVSGVCWATSTEYEVPASHFKIVDERYKPVEQKLQAPEHLPNFRCATDIKLEEESTKDISDAIFALSNAVDVMLDAGLIEQAKQAQAISRQLSDLAATRAKELERNKVVDAAYAVYMETTSTSIGKLHHLYDKGFLKLP